MSSFILLIGFACLVAGIIGLFKPSIIRAKSRWQAVPWVSAILAAVGVAQLLFPDPATGHPTTTRVFGAINILVWLFIVGFCVQRGARGAPPQRVKLSPEIIAAIRDDMDDDEEVASVQLEREFARYRAGEIDINEYRDRVLAACDAVTASIELLHARRGKMDQVDFAEQLELLEEEADECRWRLEWIEEQRTKPEVDDRFPKRGKWARFEYIGSDGNQSKRTIANWERRGIYIVGYDRSRKEERTFRQDRIAGWLAG